MPYSMKINWNSNSEILYAVCNKNDIICEQLIAMYTGRNLHCVQTGGFPHKLAGSAMYTVEKGVIIHLKVISLNKISS